MVTAVLDALATLLETAVLAGLALSGEPLALVVGVRRRRQPVAVAAAVA